MDFSTGKRVPRNLSPTHYSAGENSNMSEPLQPFVLIMSLKQCHSVTEASGTWAVKVLKKISKMDIGWYWDDIGLFFTSQLDPKSLLECWSLDFQHESWRMFPTEWMTMMTRVVLFDQVFPQVFSPRVKCAQILKWNSIDIAMRNATKATCKWAIGTITAQGRSRDPSIWDSSVAPQAVWVLSLRAFWDEPVDYHTWGTSLA